VSDRLAILKWRLGLCTCGGWACLLDSILGCRVQRVCDAHDRYITED